MKKKQKLSKMRIFLKKKRAKNAGGRKARRIEIKKRIKIKKMIRKTEIEIKKKKKRRKKTKTRKKRRKSIGQKKTIEKKIIKLWKLVKTGVVRDPLKKKVEKAGVGQKLDLIKKEKDPLHLEKSILVKMTKINIISKGKKRNRIQVPPNPPLK